MANRHFFKPLLPGFHSYLTIPEAFFVKYIEGRNEQTMAKLRSDASKIIWEVKIEEDGKKLIDGWREFALAHDIRVGDIAVFRQDGDMDFHVTLLGPSCCEIQYHSCLDNENNFEKIQRRKKVDNNPRREAASTSLDPSCFVAFVSRATLRYDTLYIPLSFVRANGLDARSGEIALVNEKGKSWSMDVREKKSGNIYIPRGWRTFCRANGLRAGDSCTFKLIQSGQTPVLRLSNTESREEDKEESSEGEEIESLSTESESDEERNLETIERKKNKEKEAEPSPLDPSCFVAKVSHATLRYDTMNLPMSFARANDLDAVIGGIVLMNKEGKSWTLDLKRKKHCGTAYIRRGWRSFCRANGLKAGGSYTFKLIQRGKTPVLRLLSEESNEEEESDEEEELSEGGDEIESLSTESESNQDEISFKTGRSRWKPSSSPSQNRFVTLTLTPNTLKKSIMFLPVQFTRTHGINEETKMTLMDKKGVKWCTDVRGEKISDRIRLIGGWKDCFKANSVKIGESVKLELIWEEDTSCVLKLCSIVKPKTK